jgi:hypothetical protein
MNWDAVQCHQALADLCRRVRIKLTSLYIAEEIVKSFVATLFVVVSSLMSHITAVAHAIINRATIRVLLLRRIVSIMSSVMSLSIATI